MEEKRARRDVHLRRPAVVVPPLVRAALEGDRLRLAQRAPVLQIKSKKGRLNAIAKIFGGRATEVDVAELLARLRVPASVIPGPNDEEILILCVELLEALIDLHRPVEILLIPPSSDIERWNRDLRQRRDQGLNLPEAVVIRMRDIVVPRRNLPVQVLGVDIRQRT